MHQFARALDGVTRKTHCEIDGQPKFLASRSHGFSQREHIGRPAAEIAVTASIAFSLSTQ